MCQTCYLSASGLEIGWTKFCVTVKFSWFFGYFYRGILKKIRSNCCKVFRVLANWTKWTGYVPGGCLGRPMGGVRCM